MKTPLGRRIFWIGLAAVAVLLPISCTATTGGIGEFSPHTLQFRARRELTIGFGAIQVYISRPKYHDKNELMNYLREHGYVSPAETSSPRWEVIFHWNHAWNDGYGVGYRNFMRNGGSTIAWCEEDVERAKFFWSEAFRLLRSDDEAEQSAGGALISHPIDYRDQAEIQTVIDTFLDLAQRRTSRRHEEPR